MSYSDNNVVGLYWWLFMKIRAVHILIDTESEREQASINCMKQLGDHGIEYVPYITKQYTGDAWKYQIPKDGWKRHGAPHFGLYRSFKDTVFDYFTEELDAFIFMEADCMISNEMDIKSFVDEIYKAVQFSNKWNTFAFSFGSRYFDGVLQSPIVKTDLDYNNFVITNKIIGCHFMLYTNSCRKFLISELLNSNWDAIDIWMNSVYYDNANTENITLGIVKNAYAYQYEAVSMIDSIVKKTKNEQ